MGKKRFLTYICAAAFFIFAGCSEVQFEEVPQVDPAPKPSEPGGQSSEVVTETFVQGAIESALDVLVVIDNSSSMSEERKKLGQAMQNFTDVLSDVDWQLAITTTDVKTNQAGRRGTLLPYKMNNNKKVINKQDSNYKDSFLEAVQRPRSNCSIFSCNSDDEQPMKATILAMEQSDSDSRDLFRNKADIAVLIVSDEDEKSSGGYSATKPDEVLDTLAEVWGDSKRLRAFAVIVQPGDRECLNSQSSRSYEGVLINELVERTGGTTASICDNDYAAGLKKIGEQAKELLNYVELLQVPEGELDVHFTPQSNTAWRLEGRRIIFDNPPPEGTVIEVSYTK
ncbi:MAG: hypothetical protein CL675_13635 [Bdellovibrionaceae bacterium]|nr:hypothetical protein [Pseudobdellovibrionaceae bacterium]